MAKIHVVGGDPLVTKLFQSDGLNITNVPEDAILGIFTGGGDVDPALYAQNNVASRGVNPERDRFEFEMYRLFRNRKIPMVGICRGGQFLNVMNGGSLWQDVDNHGISGTHSVTDARTEKRYQCTSTHHQMMIPGKRGKVLGYSGIATRKTSDKGTIFESEKGFDKQDAEVVWYKATRCLCFQPHPEYSNMSDEARNWFFGLIAEKIFARG